ncbi:MAG: hypothetical protein RI907_1462 [Pseudomonadota bacterium]|jgi:general secretion pathway protein F
MSPSAEPQATGSTALQLRVRDTLGQVRDVQLPGPSAPDAVRQAAQLGWQVLAIRHGAGHARPRSGSSAVAGFPLLMFSQELLALLDAGLHLTEAMTTLMAKARQPAERAVLQGMLTALHQGKPFSEALCSTAWACPELYLAAIRASEQTGDLPQTLARYVAYQTQLEAIRKKLVSAAIYPLMLLVVGGFVTLFLLGYVVPRFASVYDSAGRELPWLSLQLLRLGRTLHDHAVLAGVMVLGALGLAVGSVWRPQGRAWWAARLAAWPGLAPRVAEFRMARFFRAVSMLLASGIAMPKALGMVSDLLSGDQQRRLLQARRDIDMGQPLSEAMLRAGLSTPVADSLIRVGERSGQMADMLERLARFQDEDFARWLDWASRLLEPVLMTVMGLVIGMVVVLLYMPIFDLAGSLQ